MVARSLFLAPFSLVALVTPLLAEENAPGPTRELRQTVAASVNNLGLYNGFELSLRWPLSASKSALKKDAHFSVGLSQTATPAYARLGLWLELSPLSVLDVRAGVEPAFYFGTFSSLASFASYGDSFDDDARRGRAAAGFAGRIYISPTVKMRLGRFVAASSADFERWKSNARGPLFYEPARDTLLRTSGDSMLTASSVLLREAAFTTGGKLSYGFIHQLTYVDNAPRNRVQRLGLISVREWEGKRFGLKRPKIVGHVSYYLNDRSKKGQLGAAVAVSFNLAP